MQGKLGESRGYRFVAALIAVTACGFVGAAAASATPILSATPPPPGPLAFSDQLVGTSSASPQSIAISNTGDSDLTISNVLNTNETDFSIVQNCTGAPLPPSPAMGSSCSIDVTFHPATTGLKSATLTISSDDPALLSAIYGVGGTGIQGAIDEDVGALNFGSVQAGKESAPQTVTFTNSGSATVNFETDTLAIPNPFIDGPGATQFFVSSQDCTNPGEPGPLGPTDTCTVSVVFAPSLEGAKTATLTLVHDAPGSPEQVTLTGSATAPPSTDGGGTGTVTPKPRKCKHKHGKKHKKKCTKKK